MGDFVKIEQYSLVCTVDKADGKTTINAVLSTISTLPSLANDLIAFYYFDEEQWDSGLLFWVFFLEPIITGFCEV